MTPKKIATPKMPDLAIVSVIADKEDNYSLIVDADEIDDYAALGMLLAATFSQLTKVLPDTYYGYSEEDPDEDED